MAGCGLFDAGKDSESDWKVYCLLRRKGEAQETEMEEVVFNFKFTFDAIICPKNSVLEVIFDLYTFSFKVRRACLNKGRNIRGSGKPYCGRSLNAELTTTLKWVSENILGLFGA